MMPDLKRFKRIALTSFLALAPLSSAPLVPAAAFEVDRSPNPPDYAAEEPENGAWAEINPPSLIWRVDDRAASYTVELAPDENFTTGVIRTEKIPHAFYNHSAALAPGRWYWRYFVVDKTGQVSEPGPVRSFVIDKSTLKLPVPPMSTVLQQMPAHPRVFVTPSTLAAFRARRNGPAKDAWEVVREQADKLLTEKPVLTNKLVPLEEARSQIAKTPTPGISAWKKGDPTRRQVFHLDANGQAFWTPDYNYRALNVDAGKAQTLAYAYLISGDAKYAEAARLWIDFVAPFRIDYHLGDAKKRNHHDTAVYNYEQGLKDLALAYDHVYDKLTPTERAAVIAHVEYHAAAAQEFLKSVRIEVRYQQSHPQQCMHNLLTTVLATAKDSPRLDAITAWVVPQYLNRIAWTSPDGGYFEGPVYGHKFRWILEGLTALRTATGLDLFQKPEIRNSGEFWLYSMDLNYWYAHFGDIYSMLTPTSNGADSYISGLMAEMTQNPYVKWYSQTHLASPDHIPFRYLSEGPLQAKPPIDIPQARAFVQTGNLAAYDRFYDHGADRLFFRSSPWGAHSHSHADQNGFVIHSNGEVLAADTGYYTYSGDTYQTKWSKSTFSHNSILVNGQGQPTNISSKGKIENFYNGGSFTYFVGDASQAYEAPLKTFRRAMLFVRPNIYVTYDELAAGEKSTFSWLLNTFAKPEFDEANQRMTVAQQNERLQVDHLLPRGLTYSTTNKRPYPVLTKAWSRITEAFPQAWHSRADTTASSENTILTLMQTYSQDKGAEVAAGERYQTPATIGLKLKDGAGRDGVVLFRRNLNGKAVIESGGLVSDAQAASLFSTNRLPGEWMLAGGRSLSWENKDLLKTENAVSATGAYNTPAAKAVLRFEGAPGNIKLALPAAPQRVFFAANGQPANAQEVKFNYTEGILNLAISQPRGALWVDPVVDLKAPIPAATLAVKDSQGTYILPLRAAWSEKGQWVYYTQTNAREPGTYTFRRTDSAKTEGSAAPVQFLIQDLWEPVKTVRGVSPTTGTFREGSELYFHVSPGATLPAFSAELQTSARGQLVNLLRNGDFEEGIPNYPPRRWTMQRSSSSADLGWPGWSQESPHSGKSSLRFFRAGDTRTLTSPPMRLRSAGTYHLRFFAKGDAEGTEVRVMGPRGRTINVPIAVSPDWREYTTKIDLPPGYTTIQIVLNAGKPDKVLWVDDMQFGKIAE